MTTPRILTTSHGTNRDAFAPIDWGLFVSLSLIWGASFLFMAIGLDAFHPGLVTWLRVGFGAAVIAILPKARKTKIETRDLSRVGILGLVWIALPMTLFPIAQLWIDSAVAGMLNGATPIFTALLATILLRALPGRLQMAGLAVGFVGIVAIALPSAGTGTTATIGVVMVLVATIAYAVALNMVAPLQQRYGSLPVIARAQWVAAAAVTPFGIYGLTQSSFAWPSLLALLAVGVVGTGVAFVLMGTLSGRVGPTRSAFITYVIPVVALILGVVFRNEIVAPVAVIGVVLVIAGALLASRREV
ncbi:MAG: DMT family transporter [Acidobacteria bacterium]|nr:DMT family transporter [Acidobacteriota bacterium]TDI51958.1 MAG: DMT family transporter [Acidobacteriota bacterium]TDI55768.1 MAG: DMT family transporter [Acidobacteriota bacterium]